MDKEPDLLRFNIGVNLFSKVKPGDVIGHGCNAQGAQGAGIAKTIKEKYPESFPPYEKFCLDNKKSKKILGSVVIVELKDIVIANMITQHMYGSRHKFGEENMKAISDSLIATLDYCRANKKVLHIPFIGGGLAKGNKKELYSLFNKIDNFFLDVVFNVYS